MIVNPIALSWLPTALMLAELSLPHGSLSKNLSSSGFVTRRFIPNGAVPRDAWPCWIPAVERRVVYKISVPPFTINHNKYLCNFVSQITPRISGAGFAGVRLHAIVMRHRVHPIRGTLTLLDGISVLLLTVLLVLHPG